MERFLEKVDIWCWRYRERIHNYPGLNLTATTGGCDALLRVIEILRGEGPPSRRTIELKRLDPNDEAKISGGRKYRDFRKLRISLVAKTTELQQMCISSDGETAIVEMVGEELDQLKDCIADVRRGEGDFGIAPNTRKKGRYGPRDKSSESLNFWACFGHMRVGS